MEIGGFFHTRDQRIPKCRAPDPTGKCLDHLQLGFWKRHSRGTKGCGKIDMYMERNEYIYIYYIFCIYLYAYLIKWYNVFLNHGSKFHSLKLKVTQVLTSPDTDSIQPNPPIDSISDGSTTTHPKKGPHRKTNRESRCFKKMLMHVLLRLDGKPQNKSMSFWDY